MGGSGSEGKVKTFVRGAPADGKFGADYPRNPNHYSGLQKYYSAPPELLLLSYSNLNHNVVWGKRSDEREHDSFCKG